MGLSVLDGLLVSSEDAKIMIPEPYARRTFRDHLEVPGPARVLALPDIHFPFHCKPSLEVAVREGVRRKCNVILLNGDQLDCAAVASWDKDPNLPGLDVEINMVQEFIDYLRQKFPKARIIFREGNHEERVARYIWKNAPKLFGVLTMTLEKAIDRPVEYVKDKRVVRLGNLASIHGHEYRFAISNPVNPARGFFLRCKESVIGSHFHQHSTHGERTLTGHVITTWSTGCLCWLDPDYGPLNNHVNGAAVVEVDAQGHYQVDNFRIIDGEIRR